MDELISKLDTVTGMLIVESMKNPLIREAMELVMEVSVELGEME